MHASGQFDVGRIALETKCPWRAKPEENMLGTGNSGMLCSVALGRDL
jgi:hypothetical protein